MPAKQNDSGAPIGNPGITPLGVLTGSIFGMLFLALIVGLTSPLILRAKKDSDLTRSLSNCRHLGLALLEFEAEYGRFPDAGTAAAVAMRGKTDLALPGTTANDHLRQLIAAGLVSSESVFYAKTAFTRNPDNRFRTRESALAPGELGFGYLLNGDTGFNSENNPSLILLCAPLAYDGVTVSDSRFDPAPHHGKIAMLHLDNSARTWRIDEASGGPLLFGKPWLATGEGTLWAGDITPRVATPQP